MLKSIKIVCVLLGMLLSLSGCERIRISMLPETDSPTAQPLTVMTYNVYLGSSVAPVLSVENLLEVPTAVASVYNNIETSDFPGRARAIAAAIKTYQPHLIGLQEIALIRRQSPGNAITQRTPDAEEVVIDYLKVLLDALKAEGLAYSVAAKIENIDAEMPMFTDTGLVDVRLTDHDVLLARSDVAVSRPMSRNYANALSIEKLGLQVKRGYVAVDATVLGRTYRIVNTHLEAFTEAVRVSQMRELVDHLSDETLPILLLGDFNTPAPDGRAYQLLLSAGYVDLWQMHSEGAGNTCCQDGNLLNDISAHSVRIDLIFSRNLAGLPYTATTYTLGDTPLDRRPTGIWPSDHAGVVAQFAFFNTQTP